MQDPGAKKFGLDLVRAAAIVLVVIPHGLRILEPVIRQPGFGWIDGAQHFGFLGVEIFFVLSGFLIGGLLLREGTALARRDRLQRFWLRRWLRTVPNYLAFLVLNVLFFEIFQTRELAWPEGLWRFPLFLQNLTSHDGQFFPESWSLTIEEWFYLLFPILLIALLRFRLPYERALVCAVGTLIAAPLALRVGAALFAQRSWVLDTWQVTLFRFDSLMIGVSAAAFAYYFPAQWKRARTPAWIAGLALLVPAYASLFVLPLDSSFFAKTLLFDVVSLGVACLLPWASAAAPSGPALWRSAVRRTALYSYSLYLSNLNIALLLDHFWADRLPPSAVVHHFAVYGVYWVASLALAVLAYHAIERPFLRLRARVAA